MKFTAEDARKHLIKLKGKEYLQVMWRLCWFRSEREGWGLETEPLDINFEQGYALFRCTIRNENGVVMSTGHGSETSRDFGDFIEKAETKATGRALAMLGYGTQFTADEFDEGERIVDSPVELHPTTREQREDAEKAAREVGEAKLAQMNAQQPPPPTQDGNSFAPATDAQKAILRKHCNVQQLADCQRMYGQNLERLQQRHYSALMAKLGASL